MNKWNHWHYKNTFFLVVSLLLFFFFADHPYIKSAVSFVGSFGYIGAFLAGIMCVSVFTVAPSFVLLFFLAEKLNPLLLIAIAGMGAVTGDYLLFRFFKDQVFVELKPIFMANGGKTLRRLFRTPYFAWVLPFLGAAIIASPFPDEVGISLLGITKLKNWQFLLISFLLNCLEISLVVVASKSINYR